MRRVPASLAAPLEYTGLLWSFALGYLIWGDVPAQAVFLGAGLIVLSGALVVLGEWQPRRQAAPMALDGAEIARAEPSATG